MRMAISLRLAAISFLKILYVPADEQSCADAVSSLRDELINRALFIGPCGGLQWIVRLNCSKLVISKTAAYKAQAMNSRTTLFFASFISAVTLAATARAADKDGWIALFDGK